MFSGTALPFLPGYTFTNPAKKSFTSKETLRYSKGCPFADVVEPDTPRSALQLLDAQNGIEDNTLVELTYGSRREFLKKADPPDYVPLDKEILRFYGYYREELNDCWGEQFRIHRVRILYYLRDDEMEIWHPHVENSGLVHGKLLRKQAVPKPDGEVMYKWKDLNIGMDVIVYGKRIRVTDCDSWTKEYMTSAGVVVNPKIDDVPEDSHSKKLREKAAKPRLVSHNLDDEKLWKFLNKNQQVLRFFALWDDTNNDPKEMRKVKIHFFLEDDTMEVVEVHTVNDGRDPFPMVIRRQKVPIDIYNIPDTFPSCYMEYSDKEIKNWFLPKDLTIGKTITVMKKKFFIYDCDKFTRKYYQDFFDIDLPPAVDVEEKPKNPVPKDVPPHDGIGTWEDSLQSCIYAVPKPPKKDVLKIYESDDKYLRFCAHMAIGHLPDLSTIRAIIKIAWAASSGSTHLMQSSNEELHRAVEKASKQIDNEETYLCKEALEVLTITLALCPEALDSLMKEKNWHQFIIALLLICKNRSIRVSAAEQFLLIATKCYIGHQSLIFFITLLFTQLMATVKEYGKSSHEFFQLLCPLLNYACGSNCQLPTAQNLLNNEIDWLKAVREKVLTTSDSQVDEALLEGHLGVTRELVAFLGPDKKYEIGADSNAKKGNLIKELVEDFIFPASRVVLQVQKCGGELPSEQAIPVCSFPTSLVAAFELLVSLCTNCVPNIRLLAEMLTEMFYSVNDQALTEWEYLPPVGPRPPRGFVGLKNAGATCYMNSVLQQLYMIEDIRNGILAVEGAATDPNEDFSCEERMENEGVPTVCEAECGDEKNCAREETRKEYNLGVLKQVQAVFGHLACSKLQYYVPRGFWKHFKLWGEPVNLREQHDALEFFNSLVDSLDEALKYLNQPSILSQILGGSFADQKICKNCPHRYSREESFTTLNIDIRNHSNLLDSLEQYVKGDLLEGANAYHCEKCNKKVDTVKRLCIKKLPPILAIQLKRFDYDWERECAIKFNDYFEFPRELDMEPYTVRGLAKIEGEIIEDNFMDENQSPCTKYKLTGIVVHSGQASGGHYYSYILHRHSDGTYKWYKFDDGEVMECKMEDDEEMKNQCFGGEYMGEVFDHMLKRMSYRRQKRWWNAYILFYRRLDMEENITRSLNELTLSDNKQCGIKMPVAIERSVRRQNIKFMHNRNQFSIEYFQFMKKLINCNAPFVTLMPAQEKLSNDAEELAMISTQLAAKFLFTTGFHAKKTLRGPASEWYDALCIHLRHSCSVRRWFANNALFSHPQRFCEYLLECPTSEVRSAFMRIIVFLAHFSLADGAYTPPMFPSSAVPFHLNSTLSDHLLLAVLNLLKKEVSEHGRHLTQYFNLFLMYASLGVEERMQLLELNVPATFMKVALDEGPGPPIKYQYAELGKLYQVVSLLIRCCDVTSKCQSSQAGAALLPNPHAGDQVCQEYLMPIQSEVADILYNNTSYVKKIIEDSNSSEDTIKLLKFCSWENPHFSSIVLNELLWQVSYSYTYELRPYMDMLLHMLLLEDSWQNHRIHNALKSIPDDRDGLFDCIQRSKNHHQKRAYQCIKCMVSLFTNCPNALHMLHVNGEMKRKWTSAIEWLNDELERRPYPANAQYGYNNWSPPAQSNETSNGYFLERSHSAKMTLAKAFELCPDEEIEDQDMSEDGESPPPEEKVQDWQGETTTSVPQHPSPPPPAPGTGNDGSPAFTRSKICHRHDCVDARHSYYKKLAMYMQQRNTAAASVSTTNADNDLPKEQQQQQQTTPECKKPTSVEVVSTEVHSGGEEDSVALSFEKLQLKPADNGYFTLTVEQKQEEKSLLIFDSEFVAPLSSKDMRKLEYSSDVKIPSPKMSPKITKNQNKNNDRLQ